MNTKEKAKIGVSGAVSVPAGIVAYGLENFLEYITLKNEYLASGADPAYMKDLFSFFNWEVSGSGWTDDKYTGFDANSPTVANLNDKIDYNAALAPNVIIGGAAGLLGALAAKKGNKPVAIMGAAVNAASLVNLLAKGTELAQRSQEAAWTRDFGGIVYTLNGSQASAMPLYIAGIIAEAGLLALTTYLLAKDARKDYKQTAEMLGLESKFGKKE